MNPKPLMPPPFGKNRKRLPRRKQMTIAVGMLANDGIVIASDTQESTGDYMKGARTKMMSFASLDLGDNKGRAPSKSGTCTVAGAGDSGYVRALMQNIGDTFLSNPDAPSYKVMGKEIDLQVKFEDCLKSFYKEHVIPFAAYPSRDRPDVEFLIGLYRKYDLKLFKSEKTALVHAMPYGAIGIGCTFAELLLNRLYRMSTVAELAVLAAYVIFMVKESVENCGKFTMISIVHGARQIDSPEGMRLVPPWPGTEHIGQNRIEVWERAFRSEWAVAEHSAIWEKVAETAKPLRVGPAPILEPTKRSASRKSKSKQ